MARKHWVEGNMIEVIDNEGYVRRRKKGSELNDIRWPHNI